MNDRSELDKAVRRIKTLERRLATAQAELANCKQQSEREREQISSEAALRASQERLALSQEVAGIGSFDWDVSGGHVIWTEEQEHLYGLQRGEYQGNYEDWIKRVHPDDRAMVERSVQEAIAQRQEWRTEYRITRTDGAVRWIFALGRPLFDDRGKFIRFPGVNLDITERKQTEQALRLSEQRLKDAQRVGRLGSWEWVIATDWVTWSEEFFRIAGRDPATTAPDYFKQHPHLYTAESFARLQPLVAEAMRSGAPYHIDLELIRPDGSTRWIAASGEAVRDEHGRIVGLRGTVQDITERKRAEDQIRASEKKFKALTDNSPLAIYFSSGIEEKGEYVNPTFTKMFGYTLEEVPSVQHWWPLAYPDPTYREQLSKVWKKKIAHAIETHSAIEPMETTVTCKDGSKKNVLWGFVSTGAGNWSYGLDLTERKRVEKALEAREFELKEAQRLAHVGSWTWDTAHNAMQWSDEMFRIAGYGPQAFAITPDFALSLIHPDDRTRLSEKAARAAQGLPIRPFFEEYRITRPDGSVRFIESRGEPILDRDGRVVALRGTWIDLTERKQIEDALQKTLYELRSAQEQMIQTEKVVALGTMAAGIAHELNNPLMGIMGFVSYARTNPTDPKATELLGNAAQELGRMRDLIRSMLSFARPPEGKPSPVDVTRLIAHALELLKTDLKVRGIALDVETEANLARVTATPKLEQAILNLLLNARDALSGAKEKRITVRAWSEGDHVFIEIADTGPGIPENIRHRIFDPFFSTKPPGEGTGLGLSVSRTVIQDIGGELALQSHEGEGARFLIRLNKNQTSSEGSA